MPSVAAAISEAMMAFLCSRGLMSFVLRNRRDRERSAAPRKRGLFVWFSALMSGKELKRVEREGAVRRPENLVSVVEPRNCFEHGITCGVYPPGPLRGV